MTGHPPIEELEAIHGLLGGSSLSQPPGLSAFLPKYENSLFSRGFCVSEGCGDQCGLIVSTPR